MGGRVENSADSTQASLSPMRADLKELKREIAKDFESTN